MTNRPLLISILLFCFLAVNMPEANARRAFDSYGLDPETRARILREYKSGKYKSGGKKARSKPRKKRSSNYWKDKKYKWKKHNRLEKRGKKYEGLSKGGLAKIREMKPPSATDKASKKPASTK